MKFFILAGFLFLTACGFEPVYKNASLVGEPSQTSRSLNRVDIATIPNREGQALRNALIDRIYLGGYPSNPEYRLLISPITETIVEIGVDKDDNASRAQLRQETIMHLVRIDNAQTVLTRPIRATAGYNILLGQFTTFVTENDAREQAIRTLADNIVTQLELYFTRNETSP
jgi:LPS-assembly lipoprotein